TAEDAVSREVIGGLMADLVHINRATQQSEPALAKSWKVSADGLNYTLKLRRGIRFSDGQPFDADDVVFSFAVYTDEKIDSPQRDLLIIDGKPIQAAKLDQYTVRFTLARPYAAAERIFDSLAMLPRHLLEKPYREGRFLQQWSLGTPPAQLVGLGPFRLKQYLPGQRVVLERNPYYWKADSARRRLPYLDELVFVFAGNEDARLMQFEAGETDVVNRLSTQNYSLLARQAGPSGFQLEDLGPSTEYNFLLFNLNDLQSGRQPEIERKQRWFRDLRFRQAVSAAIDREGIVRLAYGGRGTPLWGNVSPGNKLWVDASVPHPQRSLETARQLLKSAGFSWNAEGKLLDSSGQPVEFSIAVASSNPQRMQMATIVQDDLSKLGIQVSVVPLEFRALLQRVFQNYNYDATVLGLGGGDADPNAEMNVWVSNGSTHLWHLGEAKPATAWEADIDRLMNQQMVTLKYQRRKRLYDQVQQIIAANLPMVFLATPDVLVAAKPVVGNFHPAVLEPTTLWNVDQLFLRQGAEMARAH
ncbi:MAG TPA: ABC transporter substrate-binding protein, partial [Terriglobales bacterium]|nr:ABC transporter substrate-binding protein [Terriglobales bacterium]